MQSPLLLSLVLVSRTTTGDGRTASTFYAVLVQSQKSVHTHSMTFVFGGSPRRRLRLMQTLRRHGRVFIQSELVGRAIDDVHGLDQDSPLH